MRLVAHVLALREIGPETQAAVPGLAHALGDPDADVRNGASRALVRMGRAAVPELQRALDAVGAGVSNTDTAIFERSIRETLRRIEGP
jgi:HEAT repeat protein